MPTICDFPYASLALNHWSSFWCDIPLKSSILSTQERVSSWLLSNFTGPSSKFLSVLTAVLFVLLFYYLFYYLFNWRIITLQYCDGFCITQYELTINIPVSPPSWTHPPTSLPTLSLWAVRCPTSRTELALAIYLTYGNVYVSVLVSQSIPPSPSPIGFKGMFFMSVSPLLPCR